MDDLEEGNKLRQLAKEYSNGVISFAVYRSKRSLLIDSYSRLKSTSTIRELAQSQKNLMGGGKQQRYGASLFAGTTLFILAFILGVGLGFVVVNFKHFPLVCDAVWYSCISLPLSP